MDSQGKEKEIEITPEMIEAGAIDVSLSMVGAGADFLRAWDGGSDAVKRGLCTSEAEIVDGIYRAMERQRLLDSAC